MPLLTRSDRASRSLPERHAATTVPVRLRAPAASITWSVDGHVYNSVAPADLPSGTEWVFNNPFFIILNLAVGGHWVGAPDEATTFPQTMLVDWVKVYGNLD